MPTDFTDGKTFPRRGREPLGEFLWLARAFDKARAKAARAHDGYIYPCPMDKAVMKRWGIAPREFTAALAGHDTDDAILRWIEERVPVESREAANEWISRKGWILDRQDAEEGVPGAPRPGQQWARIALGVAISAAIAGAVRSALRAARGR